MDSTEFYDNTLFDGNTLLLFIPLVKNYSTALYNTTPLQTQFCTHS